MSDRNPQGCPHSRAPLFHAPQGAGPEDTACPFCNYFPKDRAHWFCSNCGEEIMKGQPLHFTPILTDSCGGHQAMCSPCDAEYRPVILARWTHRALMR